MNPRLAHLLMRLYPRPWRARYGEEFELFLQSGRGGLLVSINVAWSALCERIFPTRRGNSNEDLPSPQSWFVRFPWAMFGIGPILLLAVAYFVACLYLWSGWQLFLPGAETPFGGHGGGPIYSVRNIYFQAGKFFYFGAPVLVGWAVAFTAARQRINLVWPGVGFGLIAWMGSAARIYASRTAVHSGLGNISMDFARGFSVRGVYEGLPHGLTILALMLLPYFLLRLHAWSRFRLSQSS